MELPCDVRANVQRMRDLDHEAGRKCFSDECQICYPIKPLHEDEWI